MEKRLLLLKLVLNEFGVPVDASSLDSRKSMQKAVYLAQALNVPLGYRFNWYVMGPYSPMLTEDYFNSSLQSAEDGEPALRSDIKERLKQLRVLIDESNREGAPRTDWLELLASWHYLRSAQGKSPESARRTMERSKPRLAPRVDHAEAMLQQAGMLTS